MTTVVKLGGSFKTDVINCQAIRVIRTNNIIVHCPCVSNWKGAKWSMVEMRMFILSEFNLV